MSKHLVTTALEETWPEEGSDVLFLGEWCKIYDREKKWSTYKHSVIPYHWDDRDKLYEDYSNLSSIYENILRELGYDLNNIHGVNCSLRYWRILIGPWLGWFIHMLFDRWSMLESVIQKSPGLRCMVVSRDPFSLVPNDMSEFCRKYFSDNWNEGIFGQLITMYFDQNIEIKKIKLKPERNGFDQPSGISLRKYAKSLLTRGTRWVNFLSKKQVEYFFYNSYLPWVTNCKLQLKLGQFPQFWPKESVSGASLCTKLRDSFLGTTGTKQCRFSKVARKFIPMHIPVAYLEGYKGLLHKVNESTWPTNPKEIFTSNSYCSDDFFKLWAAEKIKKGAKLNISQHGGNFGMSKFSFEEDHQIKISDKWFSWGWKRQDQSKIISLGNVKLFDQKPLKFSKKGVGVLVSMELPRYSYHLYSIPIGASQINSYFQDQIVFLNNLPKKILQSFKVRPHHASHFGNHFKQRMRDQIKDIRFDLEKNLKESASQCRLFVSSYNSTTYLESFSWGIPTIIFWNPLHWELNDDAKPYFQLLTDVGIFHSTPHSASKMVGQIWDNPQSWWDSDQVKKVRDKFCLNFSNKIDKVNILKKNIL